jgi:hypothetical protein
LQLGKKLLRPPTPTYTTTAFKVNDSSLPQSHLCTIFLKARMCMETSTARNRRWLPMQSPQGIRLFCQQLGTLVVNP